MNKISPNLINESLNFNNLVQEKKGDLNKQKTSSIFKPIFRCTECCLIPLLTIKENDSKIIINCSNNHNKEMSINEYIEKGLKNGINSIICSECSSKLEPKKRFKFCSECIKIFCKNCLKKHNNSQTNTEHETISLKKMDTFCCLHKTRYTHYCQICHKNICKNCFYLHNNHQILSLKEIKLTKEEIKESKENLIKEENAINEICEIFKTNLNSIQKKFDDVIKNKKLIIEFKKIIEDIYEKKDSNFQIIENMKRLKYNTEKIHLENDMNELDILFEIFNYLNCIDYNIDTPMSNNQSSKKNISIKTNKPYNKKKILYNDVTVNNSVPKDSTEFIYERKHKKIFSNYTYKKEEEKNSEKNSSNKKINNKSVIDDRFITNYDDSSKKYLKKRIKERIIYQRSSNENTDKKRDFSYQTVNNYKILNDSNNNINIDNIPEKIINNNIINKFKIEEIDIKENKEICPKFEEEDEDDNDNDNEFNENNGFDDLIINEELKNKKNEHQKNGNKENKEKIKISQKSKDEIRKSKSKDKLKRRKSKENIKEEINNEESFDNLNENNVFVKARDKSKERRIKIKKENLSKSQNINQLNNTFTKQINSLDNFTDTDFEYTYQYNKEKELNITKIFNNENENNKSQIKSTKNNFNGKENIDDNVKNFAEIEKRNILSKDNSIVVECNKIENDEINDKNIEKNNDEKSIDNNKEKIIKKKKTNKKKKKIRKINIIADDSSFDDLSNNEKEPGVQTEILLKKKIKLRII